MTSNVSRKKWTLEEEFKLEELIKKYGTNDWKAISSELSDRSPRSCRSRWVSFIQMRKTHTWTPDEDEKLTKVINENGPNWSKIQVFFPGISEYQIRQRWYHLINSKSQNDLSINANLVSKSENSINPKILIQEESSNIKKFYSNKGCKIISPEVTSIYLPYSVDINLPSQLLKVQFPNSLLSIINDGIKSGKIRNNH